MATPKKLEIPKELLGRAQNPFSAKMGRDIEEEQRQEAVVEVVGGRPLEEEDKHLACLVLGR